jgi:hypothetical protein
MLSDKQEKEYLYRFESTLDTYIGKEYNHGVLMHLTMMFKLSLRDFVNDSVKIAMFNTDRTVESFKEDIKTIKKNGFKPIGVAQIYFEDTFIFETQEEAERAYNTLDKDSSLVVGYWYGKCDFFDEVINYEKDGETNSKVKIIWL